MVFQKFIDKMCDEELYAYSWHLDEEYTDDTFIRIYGLDKDNNNVCVGVNGFRPVVWLELPRFIKWNRSNLDKLNHYLKKSFPDIKTTYKSQRKLYGANLKLIDPSSQTTEVHTAEQYEIERFPFLRCSFTVWKYAFNFANKLKVKINVPGLGYLSFKVHGQDADPVLQMTSKLDLPTSGWISFKGVEVTADEDKFTFGTREFMVNLTNNNHILQKSPTTLVPHPLILSFDLEVNSEDAVTMPKATRPGDVVFQISCVFFKLGSDKYEKVLLSLGNPSENVVGAEVRTYTTEKKLLMGYRDLVCEKNPNVIIGYNIFSFDIPYMMDRSNHKAIYPEWSQQGFAKGKCGIPREIKWSSSAYKNQEFKYLDCEGRLYVDLLPVVQRDFKLNNYKLKTVSSHFLGETKDDLDPKSIFLCYREGVKDSSPKSVEYMSICGKYCIQDSMLVAKLFEKLNVWFGLSEMAVVCNVPIITLFTKGQQIKVYSNLYKYCWHNGIVPEKNGYLVSENERYVGAYVFAPKPGLYENVVPLDFSALYPSLIIAYNIDYTTCVFDPKVPDELCHVMEWEDHISCKHDPKIIEKIRLTKAIDNLVDAKGDKTTISDYRKQRSNITKSLNKNVMCEKRRYRFLKADNEKFKGVLPIIVQSLLDARVSTRKEISKLKETIKTTTDLSKVNDIETVISILNQRQLAYKVSANSMYGITGVKAGLLPFMPVAMSITFMGRQNILKAADYGREHFGGELVYIDTDSNYFSFSRAKTFKELWELAIKVAEEISALFPPPMKLEFEESIYTKFLILTKKRYMYQTASKDGTISPKIGKRGVLLSRRDNSMFIRNCYENMVKLIFEVDSASTMKTKVVSSILNDVDAMFGGQLSTDHFVITKSSGDYGNLVPHYFKNEKGVHRAMVGQYNVPFLTDDIRSDEGIDSAQQETDWYLSKLPAHIQLLEKIKRRGVDTVEGCRLEYVITDNYDLRSKQSEKIEILGYYSKNKDVIKLDYLYYLSRLVNPVDQVLEVVFGLKDFMKNHYSWRVSKKKTFDELLSLTSPKFDVEKDRLYLLRLEKDDDYLIVHGPKTKSKKMVESTQAATTLLKLDYVPIYNGNFCDYLKAKYGSSKSLLKTRLAFKDGNNNVFTLKNDTTEKMLISTIKRECKKC
jgi:DNA polymerase elongation subunit (family B)